MGLSGIFFAYICYLWQPGLPAKIVKILRGVHVLFFRKWFFDEIYQAVFVKNSIALGRVFWKSDKALIDGLGPDGSAKVSQVIYVARDNQKAIVLGKGGSRIKQVREAAQAELVEMLERKVHLFLFVKVRENWQEDPERYREMGLDFES